MTNRALLALTLVIATTGCASSSHPLIQTGATLYPEPGPDEITFWGHACAYIDLDGFGIVTDPMFAARWTIGRNRLIPIPPAEAYDQARIVLISHAHHDHLNAGTLARFSRATILLAPAPAVKYLARRGIHARLMKPGSEYAIPGGRIVAVMARHPGGRFGVKPRADGRALGYVIQTSRVTIYYSGDTNFFSGFKAVGTRYHPDVAILNVNRHLHSRQAIRAIADLGSPVVIPAHYGAYKSPSAKLEPRWRGELVQTFGEKVALLEVGETLHLSDVAPRRSESSPSDTSTWAPR